MQLSLSSAPSESNLAAVLMGGDARPADAGTLPSANSAAFAAVFDSVAPTPASAAPSGAPAQEGEPAAATAMQSPNAESAADTPTTDEMPTAVVRTIKALTPAGNSRSAESPKSSGTSRDEKKTTADGSEAAALMMTLFGPPASPVELGVPADGEDVEGVVTEGAEGDVSGAGAFGASANSGASFGSRGAASVAGAGATASVVTPFVVRSAVAANEAAALSPDADSAASVATDPSAEASDQSPSASAGQGGAAFRSAPLPEGTARPLPAMAAVAAKYNATDPVSNRAATVALTTPASSVQAGASVGGALAAPVSAAATDAAAPTIPVVAANEPGMSPSATAAQPGALGQTGAGNPDTPRQDGQGSERGEQQAEKFAATVDEISSRRGGALKARAKSFVASGGKQVTESDQPFGIGTAKSSDTMPAGSNLARSNVSAALDGVANASATVARSEGSTPVPAAFELTPTAHRAVEAVLSATERFSARDQHSVNLQFSVGGADLSVRVELRQGEVRTTFRTDSAELRDALSQEWQTVTANNTADRPLRLASPVFTSSDSGTSSFSGEQASQQRQAHGESRGTFGSPHPRANTAGTTTNAGTSVAPAAARTVSVTSHHLHTLA